MEPGGGSVLEACSNTPTGAVSILNIRRKPGALWHYGWDPIALSKPEHGDAHANLAL